MIKRMIASVVVALALTVPLYVVIASMSRFTLSDLLSFLLLLGVLVVLIGSAVWGFGVLLKERVRLGLGAASLV